MYWGGSGPEQRWVGSLLLELLVRGGSLNFQLPMGVVGGSSHFIIEIRTHLNNYRFQS